MPTTKLESQEYIKDLVHYLTNLVSENRKKKFDDVLNYRTRHITIALEDIFQTHNASAVLRSCDIFGIQDIHIIENRNEYVPNKDIAMGSAQWLNTYVYKNEENNTLNCINQLKEKGYRIVATSPHETDCTIDELPIDKPLALIFGTELTGISDTVKEHADEFVKIPMYGFTESFNISVSVALSLSTLTKKMHQSTTDWQLNDQEKDILLLKWLRNTIKLVDMVEKDYRNKKTKC